MNKDKEARIGPGVFPEAVSMANARKELLDGTVLYEYLRDPGKASLVAKGHNYMLLFKGNDG
jgi:hypothetical protein